MDERKIIFAWFDRLEKMNKGVRRILALVSFLLLIGVCLALIIGGLLALYDHGLPSEHIWLILAGIIMYAIMIAVGYWLFWQIIRVILWVYDGFQDEKMGD